MLADEESRRLDALKSSLAADIVEIVVLTDDGAFLRTLREAVGGARRLWHVPSADKVSDLLVAGGVGIFVLDVRAVHEAAVFISQIKRQFPDLVLVVAGHRDDETALAGLISAGTIYRFIHKPMSPARAKLFAEAAIKKYDERRRRAAENPPLPRVSKAGRYWVAGCLAALALIAAVTFLVHRSTSEQSLPSDAATAKPMGEEAQLSRAAAALAANRLTEPPGNNALELYSDVRSRDPADAAARTGLAEVYERLLARAENALLEERLDEAAAAIETARKAGVESGRVAFLSAQLARSRDRYKSAQAQAQLQALARTRNEPKPEANGVAPLIERRELPHAAVVLEGAGTIAAPANTESTQASLAAARSETAGKQVDTGQADGKPADSKPADTQQAQGETSSQLLSTANERLQQDLLIEPANDSAKYFLIRLRQVDPGNAGLAAALQDLGSRLSAKARRALALEQYDAARSWLDEALALSFSSTELTAVQRDLDAAVARQKFLTNLVPANTLMQLKTAKPIYPTKAEYSKTEGWVDVEFTVTEIGKVKDPVVRAASVANVFDDAALKAVAQWRYQPVVRDGKPVAVRTQMRIRFSLT